MLAAAALDAARAGEVERCGGERLALEFAGSSGHSPHVRLSAAGKVGAFLLDYGATFSTLAQDRFPAEAGRGLVSFSLPTFSFGRFKLTRYWTERTPQGGLLGVVGTDFLALLTADFSFRKGDVFLMASACDPERLRRRGLVPIRQTGFFSRDRQRVAPGRPAVPVLYLRLAGIATWAQIDTGYDDTGAAPSVDINEPLFARLLAAGANLKREADLTVSTCAGVETRETYNLTQAVVETETGAPIQALETVRLLRKPRNACGGIAGLAEPAAQVAASLLTRAGEAVFDPFAELIWLPAAR